MHDDVYPYQRDFLLTSDGISPLRAKISKAILSSGFRDGIRTGRLARMVHEPTSTVRKELRRMEADGLVVKVPEWSTARNFIWRLLEVAGEAQGGPK